VAGDVGDQRPEILVLPGGFHLGLPELPFFRLDAIQSDLAYSPPKKVAGQGQLDPLPEENRGRLGGRTAWWGCVEIPGSSQMERQHYTRKICGVRFGYPKDSLSQSSISTGFQRVFGNRADRNSQGLPSMPVRPLHPGCIRDIHRANHCTCLGMVGPHARRR
jgi:hypothetical protein